MWFYSSSLYSSVPDILQVIWCVSSGKVNQLLSWSASSLIHKKSALFESESAVQLLWQLDFKRKCTVLRGICLIPKQILHPSCPGRNDFKSVSCKRDFQLSSLAQLPLAPWKGWSRCSSGGSCCLWAPCKHKGAAHCKGSWGTGGTGQKTEQHSAETECPPCLGRHTKLTSSAGAKSF